MGKYLIIFIILLSAECSTTELIKPAGIIVNVSADSIRFAAIGDFGDSGINEAEVADLIKLLEPDFIITSGDNNYPDGKTETIQENISQYYCEYIYNFDAPADQQCNGKAFDEKINKFFPTLGNHDYRNSNGSIPYLNFFTLPGNESYYEFIWGPVHFYALDSNKDIDKQHLWFNEKLKGSEQAFNIVYFHHSPYSSGIHGNEKDMQWDFAGVDLVLTGHDHIYEHIEKKDGGSPVYLISGLGGREKRFCNEHPLDENIFNTFCYDESYGCTFVEATTNSLKVKFISTDNVIIDSFEIKK